MTLPSSGTLRIHIDRFVHSALVTTQCGTTGASTGKIWLEEMLQ